MSGAALEKLVNRLALYDVIGEGGNWLFIFPQYELIIFDKAMAITKIGQSVGVTFDEPHWVIKRKENGYYLYQYTAGVLNINVNINAPEDAFIQELFESIKD